MPPLMKYSSLILINLSVNNPESSYTLGVNTESIYPGLDGVARHANESTLGG